MNKTLLFILSLILICLQATAQRRTSADYENYIKKYAPIAVEQMKKHSIPASITLAQGLIESGAGTSEMASRGNNHFGIKCHDWTGKRQYHNDDMDNECFRAYNSARESFEDHSLFLKRKRYERLFTYDITDYKKWAHGLKACGYATNPVYAKTLIDIIERYQLYQYDSQKTSSKDDLGGGIYAVNYINDIPYVVARAGDSFKSIGEAVDKSYRKLARYNERDKKDVLEEGDIVFLKKKARKGEKAHKGKVYRVKAGDSMYSISQKFGIRLKNLYKMNDLSPENNVEVGFPLRLR
ncbi:MAG: glucosaminidase domain-containing protein [Bacteroidaceae bacterium]|nr:glucosaminidase domain-containing protein [Bacteroidaceae bacterium]